MRNSTKAADAWWGRRLGDMTREELMEAIVELGEMYRRALEDNIQRLSRLVRKQT